MRRTLFAGVAAALLAALPLHADEAAHAQKLESLGAKVTRTAGAITEVAFTDCSKLGDAEYRALGQTAGLKRLTLFGGKHTLTDETVGHLLGLQQLESFSSEGAWLSDAGLARLAALKNLRAAAFFHLSFKKEGFTGQGFAAWKALPKLEKLTVAGMSMGDAGFAEIARISTLRELSTWHTWQTEAGNAEIAKLPLTTLKVGQRLPRNPGLPASFSDASLTTFARIQTLETLRLTEARLSLAGLRALKALPKLKQLLISECELSESDLAALRAELPAVKIEFQPQTDEQRKKLEMYLR